MSFARRTAAVVQQCSRKQPRQQSSRQRSDEIENEPPPRQQLSRPSLTTFEDRVTSVTQELVGAYAQRTTQLEAEVSGLRSDLERRKRAEAEVAAERDRLEDLLRRCDADLDEERAAAREALLAVELVEEALRASGAHDDFGSDSDESWADKDGLVATPSPFARETPPRTPSAPTARRATLLGARARRELKRWAARRERAVNAAADADAAVNARQAHVDARAADDEVSRGRLGQLRVAAAEALRALSRPADDVSTDEIDMRVRAARDALGRVAATIARDLADLDVREAALSARELSGDALRGGVDLCENSSLSHFSAMTWPRWLRRAVRSRHRHAIEQMSRRWRGGQRGDSGRTRRRFDFHTTGYQTAPKKS